MPYSTIDKSTDYFDTKTYTQSGSNNNGNTQTLTMDNVGWVWIKNRDYTNGHCIFDIVRGGDKLLTTNGTAAAETIGGGLTFGASDTTIGADTGGYGFNNRVGDDYVAWHWRTSGSQGSSNTDGSINTTYTSASTTSGFSISTYTGTGSAATVGHGLGAVPKMIMVKKTSGSESWGVYHHSIGNTHFLQLNTSGGDSNNDTFWNDTTPTSSVFSIKSDGGVNASGQTYVAYCFAEKIGFSKFGTYNGNGNADGPFIYTGFKPAFVIIKRTDATANWVMTDNKISFNGKGSNNSTVLFPSTSAVESDAYGLMLHSNGFKFSGSDSASATVNGSGNKYIFMAFAEAPLVGSNNVPATAR